MTRSTLRPTSHALLLLFAIGAPLDAQAGANDIARAIASWTTVEAPPGHEPAVAATLLRAFPGWTADGQGNLIKRVGGGTPRRVIACAMDVSAYVVSQITNDGYLRLRRTGNPGHPLWDQFHEAQRVAILTARGRREGVVAVANGHFAQQHRGDTAARTMDDLWVDVGAASRAEAEQLGIALIDPVTIDRPAWTFAGYVAGPSAGTRAGCAALATAANGRVSAGETIFVISNQRIFGWRGLATAMARLGPVASLTLLDEGAPLPREAVVVSDRFTPQRHNAVARTARADSVRVLAPRVRFARSLVETVHGDDARALLQAIAGAGALSIEGVSWATVAADTARTLASRAGTLGQVERQWLSLIDLPGVAGHEHLVREAVRAALPDWARRIAVVDSIGNVIVAMGPDRDSVAFIAHMDEVGFEVTNILHDGRVALRTRGGAVVPSWEGTPAYLHVDLTSGLTSGALRGVFVPRDTGRLRSPAGLTAWFGMDSAALVSAGARVGQSLTSYKRAARLAGTRVTGRGSDDRSGSTALLWAIRRIRPDSLRNKVIFVWSVQEEGGLNGARFFGNAHGQSLKRVYSVDTFVSSDTPLESPHFAYAPLGKGAVLRAVDNSSIVPREDRERIVRLARAAGIPLQVGTTFGGTDGSAIQQWGPHNIGLSWPGRYSHGPAEVLDLKDLEALSRLIVAVATAR